MADQESTLVFNGVHADGGYLHKPMPADAVARAVLGDGGIRWAREEVGRSRGPCEGVNPLDLASAGWGVIFAGDGDPAVRRALGPLLERRRRQAGERFQEFIGDGGFSPREKALNFLVRHGTGPSCADPEVVPYYLLLVGGPAEIPFAFQRGLQGPYAVGRLALSSVEGYAAYARAVVAAEERSRKLERRAIFFGVLNPDDVATIQSRHHLVQPLGEDLGKRHPEWTIDTVLDDEAHRQRLLRLFGDEAPSLLFTAGHGVGFRSGHRLQRERQGALLCSDWRGPKQAPGPVGPETYVTAEDLPAGGFRGRIAFHFACYSGGTPVDDAFQRNGSPGSPLAPQPFVARLPQRLLEEGEALAVVGHIERAWGYSFLWQGVGRQTQAFRGALSLLMQGAPVGRAMDTFAQRAADLGRIILEQIDEQRRGGAVDPHLVAALWTASTDAAHYAVLGDPAVRLPLREAGESGDEG